MRIFSRYVFRQAAGALLLILSSLSGIVWIALALRELNVVTSQGQDAFMLVKMTTLALPNLMAIVAPFAFLIAALHTLNRLNSDSELIVLTAAGSTIWSVARPLLLLAAFVSVFLAFINHVGQPWSMRLLRDYIVQVRTDLLTQVIQPGRFTSPEPNLMFHIRERALNGELIGLVMHDTRDKTQAQSYLAERGIIVKQDQTAYLVMTAGHIIRRTDANEPLRSSRSTNTSSISIASSRRIPAPTNIARASAICRNCSIRSPKADGTNSSPANSARSCMSVSLARSIRSPLP